MHISLSLSGGGYRASAYHLGVLSYLNRLEMGDGSKLLDYVNTITGVSGGAITAMWYVLNEINSKSRIKTFRELFHKLEDTNFADEVSKRAFNMQSGEHRLIKILSSVYDDIFFNGKEFSSILYGIEKNHIQNFAVDATDFNSSLPFRFQATHKYSGTFPYGYIGNRYYSVPRELAAKIKLSDILAASSCFPIAFEPLVIDSTYNKEFSESSFIQSNGNMVLMDGGIIDNMAIDPALRAYDREKQQNKEIDLFILSDVSNEDFEKYNESECKGVEKSVMDYINTYKNIKTVCWVVLLISLVMIGVSAYFSNFATLAFFAGVSVCVVTALYFSNKYIRIPKEVPKIKVRGFELPITELLNTKIKYLKKAFLDRLSSAALMSNDIVMMHIRRKYKDYIFKDTALKPKMLLNEESTLLDNGNWKDRMLNYKFLPATMRPSKTIHDITDTACGFPTTLWFSDEAKSEKMMDKLVACGQYTTCWNLLLLLHKVENNLASQQLNPLLKLKDQLLNDWKKFCNDPLYMVSQIK